MNKKYYIILDKKYENGFKKYTPGLNIINQNKEGDKWIYLTEIKTIETYIKHGGYYFCEVFLPGENPFFKTIKNSNGQIYGVNIIIIGTPMKLSKYKTWKYIVSLGVNITPDIINECMIKGYDKVLDYFIAENLYPYVKNNPNYYCGCIYKGGYLGEIIKEIKTRKDVSGLACIAADFGHYHIIKYLLRQKGKYIWDLNKIALYACKNAHLAIVKYLVKLGVNIRFGNDIMIWVSYNFQRYNVLKYLLKIDNTIINVIDKNDFYQFKSFLAEEKSMDLGYGFHHYEQLYPVILPEEEVPYIGLTRKIIKKYDFASKIKIKSYKILYKWFSIRRCFSYYHPKSEKYNYQHKDNPFKNYFNYFGIYDEESCHLKINDNYNNLRKIYDMDE
ncbi:ankyrin repeat protein [Moumouvirus australiensis]|uniref:Ankyrin repeat protein n=1 Tax=Moumouvirus australiensis TaxID=2109587 RepID=A0A2P1EKR6_9VIRU|nr:ankyrin repeat protein [Moumouvirus australiensis]AVL94480.1 ankyrin repeat protein [Moumouvirus australiensis]